MSLRSAHVAAEDPERLERIRLLEEVKSVAAAVQARETAAFVSSQRAKHAAAQAAAQTFEEKTRARDAGRAIAHEVALARRVSPHAARRYIGWAMILTSELPQTFRALADGQVSEDRALTVARETVFLSADHRGEVDREIAPRLENWGDRRVEAETRKAAYRLDPHGFVARVRGAESDRRVTIRPAPDAMVRLTGFVPAAEGVAAYAALSKHADSLTASGDERGRGRIMSETFVERLTGQATAADVPVEVNVIMTDLALLTPAPASTADDTEVDAVDAARAEPAHLVGYGPIPAEVARRLILRPGGKAPRWLRRLYRHPDTGQLAGMDTHRRLFTRSQRHFLLLRDHTCRTSWCDAPIRHYDHVVAHDDGGPTAVDNGQGKCVACNLAKQALGWREYPGERPGEIVTETPNGQSCSSEPPDPPGARTRRSPTVLRPASRPNPGTSNAANATPGRSTARAAAGRAVRHPRRCAQRSER